MQLEERIGQMIEPAVCDLGFSIVRVQLSGTHNLRLQIMVEPIAEGKITVDHCAMISRTVSALLDVDDPIEDTYTLEVSSPGLDRPLVELRDFERFIGYSARIETIAAIDGRKRFRGSLGKVEDNTIIIIIDNEEWAIPYSSVRRAKLVMSGEELGDQKTMKTVVESASELV